MSSLHTLNELSVLDRIDLKIETPFIYKIFTLLQQYFYPEQNTDQDVENMKKACQKYRENLIEIEQRLIEQQAGCYNIFTREER